MSFSSLDQKQKGQRGPEGGDTRDEGRMLLLTPKES